MNNVQEQYPKLTNLFDGCIIVHMDTCLKELDNYGHAYCLHLAEAMKIVAEERMCGVALNDNWR